MRTSAWEARFKTSTESLISNEKASAAIKPRSASSSREKSFENKIHDVMRAFEPNGDNVGLHDR